MKDTKNKEQGLTRTSNGVQRYLDDLLTEEATNRQPVGVLRDTESC